MARLEIFLTPMPRLRIELTSVELHQTVGPKKDALSAELPQLRHLDPILWTNKTRMPTEGTMQQESLKLHKMPLGWAAQPKFLKLFRAISICMP